MNIQLLSEKILKCLLKKYESDETELFTFEYIKNKFPGYSPDYISKATVILKHQDCVDITIADDEIYIIHLLPEGIQKAQSNTKFKKFYSFLKELKNFLR